MRIIFFIYFFVSILYSTQLQKPKVYDKNIHNISGWYMSEKLDGIRAYWNGKELLSKNQHKINAPKWFIKNFPNFELDGELWTKRGDFENIQNIVLDKKPSKKWSEISYNIFEVPHQKGDFQKRLDVLKAYLKQHPNKYIKIIPQKICKDKKALDSYLQKLLKQGAEGLIVKNPKLGYFTGRSSQILKVKTFRDTEGEVISINYNKNGSFKSLKLRLENGVVFNLGGGFSNIEKKNHPKIGDIVSFKYYGFTKNNKPKFASFLRVRQTE